MSIVDIVNSCPSFAVSALSNVYRGKVFVVSMRGNDAIVHFAKTRRGADGYVKRHSTPYYSDWSHELVKTPYDVTEIAESNIVHPNTDRGIWYRWLKEVNGHDYIYDNVIGELNSLNPTNEIREYVESAIAEMRSGKGLTVLDEYEETEIPVVEHTFVNGGTPPNNTDTENATDPESIPVEIVEDNRRTIVRIPSADITVKGDYGSHIDSDKLQSAVSALYPNGDIGYSAAQHDYDYIPPTTLDTFKPGQSVPMHRIMLKWSECDIVNGGEMFTTWRDANNFVARIAQSHVNEYGTDGGYYKTSFLVCFADGNTYQGRLDVNERDDNNISEYIETELKFHAGLYCPAHMTESDYNAYLDNVKVNRDEYREFLDTYQLTDNVPTSPDDKPRRRDNGAKVIDFASALQDKQQQDQRSAAFDYFTSELLPNMTDEDMRRVMETDNLQTELLRIMVKHKIKTRFNV